jgi:hypothetical protein
MSVKITGPVVVAGVGGSGTRVIYQILSQLQFYLGGDINKNGDNLWFTVLFKHPPLLENDSQSRPSQIQINLDIFNRLMTGNAPLTDDESYHFFKSANGYYRKLRPSLTKERVEERMKVLKARSENDPNDFNPNRWGWKEPNSFIFLDQLSRFYPGMKFIFIIRHGLDMAYAARNQYLYWWSFLGLGPEEAFETEPVPLLKLKYWIAANRFALKHGPRLLGDRFLVINFDDLCLHPCETVDKLLAFLNLDESLEMRSKLYMTPKIPNSAGRYKTQDINIFSTQQLEAVKEFGFTL